ncbi:hypothetical protein V6N13_001248 [Hibiscus sabdariffa]
MLPVIIMAVQAHLYPENLGLPLPMCGLQLQDWMPIPAPPLPSFHADFYYPPQQTLPSLLDQNAQNLSSASSLPSSIYDSFLSMPLSQSLDAQLEVQRQELDCILHLQNERLKSVLREQRKRQLAALIKVMESKALHLMTKKEQDLARATKKTEELEACLKKAEMETESWERVAKANEAMVLDLSNALEQVKEGLNRVSSAAEDAESLCCGSCDQQDVKAESRKKIACKHCHSRSSCVLFLPCRHLCSCMSCGAFLDSCPVCKSVKEASMEILPQEEKNRNILNFFTGNAIASSLLRSQTFECVAGDSSEPYGYNVFKTRERTVYSSMNMMLLEWGMDWRLTF